jgi:selenocysteine lyase/cysteine desulfurase
MAPALSASLADLRAREFSRLDAGGHVYLDFTGSALYAESHVRAHADLLSGVVLGNPHSRNPTSRAATEQVEAVRTRVLDYFDADPAEYEVVFTPNATGALKLIAESFPFDGGSRFVLTADNHNSAHGIREYAAARGAEVRYVPFGQDLRIPDIRAALAGADRTRKHLFAFPAQSNFSGVKHPLEWIDVAHEEGYHAYLDAAAFVPTSRLSLRKCSPDFVCVSFYKMFGYPTGVGALLARCDALTELRRPWFSGGTVRFVSAQPGVELLYPTARGFEDGTLNFLGILAIPGGLDLMESVGIDRINAHVMGLAKVLLREMGEIRHSNGEPMVCVYGPRDTDQRGATIAFNLLDPDGRVWDFRAVDDRAAAANLSLRTGYFCNPGAAENALAHPDAEVRRCVGTFTPATFDIQEFSECLEDRAVGAVRVSLGLPSNDADVRRFLDFVSGFRDVQAPAPNRPAGSG